MAPLSFPSDSGSRPAVPFVAQFKYDPPEKRARLQPSGEITVPQKGLEDLWELAVSMLTPGEIIATRLVNRFFHQLSDKAQGQALVNRTYLHFSTFLREAQILGREMQCPQIRAAVKTHIDAIREYPIPKDFFKERVIGTGYAPFELILCMPKLCKLDFSDGALARLSDEDVEFIAGEANGRDEATARLVTTRLKPFFNSLYKPLEDESAPFSSRSPSICDTITVLDFSRNSPVIFRTHFLLIPAHNGPGLTPRFPKVTTFKIAGAGLTDEYLVFTQHLPSLTHLDLSQNPGITDKGLECLAGDNMEKLKILLLEGLPQISDKGVKAVMDSCPSLEEVHVAGCTNVNTRSCLGKNTP